MDDIDFLQKVAIRLKHLHHFIVSLAIEEAVKWVVFLKVHIAAVIDWAGRLDAVLHAGIEIIKTEVRRGMD